MAVTCGLRGRSPAWRWLSVIARSSHQHHQQPRHHLRMMSAQATHNQPAPTVISGQTYPKDSWTNVTPKILDKLGRNLHNQKYHPVNLIRQRIQNHFYKRFVNRVGNPLFAVFDNISPVVSVYQNFDSLLIPPDHPSRSRSDTYYLREDVLLRGQTSAHQQELIQMGFDAFLVVGDVYRRDEIDATHYPVFHQLEGVRLFNQTQVFENVKDPDGLTVFEDDSRRQPDKQEHHTIDAAKLIEYDLKTTLTNLAQVLFGEDVVYRWVDAYFPFTHPSWELEIRYQDDWLEVLGAGIMEQQILRNAGAGDKIGWAFGLGLERLAMKLYDIPDIRVFWSQDPRILDQFRVEDPATPITYKAVSTQQPCVTDLSFWLPSTDNASNAEFSANEFYDIVRSVGGDLVERVELLDQFVHPAHGRTSHCYRLTYRHMERTLTQAEVNVVHERIGQTAAKTLGVEIR